MQSKLGHITGKRSSFSKLVNSDNDERCVLICKQFKITAVETF